MITSNTVRIYSSELYSSPVYSGTAGALIGLLNACLISGFNTVSLSSIVISNNVATCTSSGAHNLFLFRNMVGPIIRISGATSLTGINGDWRVSSIVSPTVFTVNISEVEDGTVSGTLICKIAPADWTSPYTGTNLAVYRPPEGNRFSLRVDDTNTTYALVRAAESFNAVSSPTNSFPLTAQVGDTNCRWVKSNSADSTARSWILLADSKRMYFFPMWNTSYSWRDVYIFGDMVSYMTNDGFATILSFSRSTSTTVTGSYNSVFAPQETTYVPYIARSFIQLGGAQSLTFAYRNTGAAHQSPGHTNMTDYLPFPNPIDNSLVLRGICEYKENNTTLALRGKLPGIYFPYHQLPLIDGDVVTNVENLTNKTLMAISYQSSYTNSDTNPSRLFVDVTSW